MNDKEAHRIYKEILHHVLRFAEDDGKIDLLEGAEILADWRDANANIKTNIFDRTLSLQYGQGTNTASDEMCTVLYKGVYANVWRHYGMASPGCPFGFFNDKDEFVVCYDSNIKSPSDNEYDIVITVTREADRKFHMKEMIGTITDILPFIDNMLRLNGPIRFYKSDTDNSSYADIVRVCMEDVDWGDTYSTLCGYDKEGKNFVLENLQSDEPSRNYDSIEKLYRQALDSWKVKTDILMEEYASLNINQQFGNS